MFTLHSHTWWTYLGHDEGFWSKTACQGISLATLAVDVVDPGSICPPQDASGKWRLPVAIPEPKHVMSSGKNMEKQHWKKTSWYIKTLGNQKHKTKEIVIFTASSLSWIKVLWGGACRRHICKKIRNHLPPQKNGWVLKFIYIMVVNNPSIRPNS